MISVAQGRLRARPRALLSAGALVLCGALTLGLSPVAVADPGEVPEVPAPTEAGTTNDYIVTLADAPVAAYQGEVRGYDATKPAEGESVDLASADARHYRSYLRDQQDEAAAQVGTSPEERFEVGVNAFTAELTAEQAARLASADGVVSVARDKLRPVPDQKNPVDFLGLSGANGVWSQLGGVSKAGRGVVVGVIDSGIWPESASFAGRQLSDGPPSKTPEGKDFEVSAGTSKSLNTTRPPDEAGSADDSGPADDSGAADEAGPSQAEADETGAGETEAGGGQHGGEGHTDGRFVPYWDGDKITVTKSDGGTFTGTCQSGEQFTVKDCSTKLVGARYFGDTWLSRVPPDQRADYVSPRDGEGHGSHVASIASGNHGVRAVVDGRDYGDISGVAPAAMIASYKVLWQARDPLQSGAYDSDVLAAIEAAISDGVDVINFSVSGADDPTNPVQLAFMSAASAGIFVATAAGNSGPAASTVQNTAPWVTTVGAHTIAPYYGTVTLGDGRDFAGVSTTVDERVGPAPLVNGAAVAAAGQPAASAAVCASGSLDPGKVAGAIVVCDRGGGVGRLLKSAEVAAAGGIGMVLDNPTDNTLDGDLHSVPTVHVNPPASAAIKAYADTPGATATLSDGNQTDSSIAYPQIATFSARGPSKGTGGDTLKPDLVAPGVTILGAAAPPTNNDQGFRFGSGTSQSAPLVAGLAALWFGAGQRPTWSPMSVKSALMTTATDLRDDHGARVRDPYTQGAGRVVPERMLSPGLVFDSDQRDWLAYLEGLGLGTGSGVPAIDPSDLNSPSIAIGRLVGTQTVTRRLTAVRPGTYVATARIPGVRVSMHPSRLTFGKAGQTKTVRVTFTRDDAPLDQAATGFLSLERTETAKVRCVPALGKHPSKDRCFPVIGKHQATVRIPLSVTPRAVEAPAQVAGNGGTGEVAFKVVPGTSGRFPITPSGLVTGAPRTGSLPVGYNVQFAVEVAAGAQVSRFTAAAGTAGANLDLYVYRMVNGAAVLVGRSVSSASRESVVLPRPPAGTYVGLVYNAANAPGTTSTPLTFRAATLLPGAGEGGFAVHPAAPKVLAGRSFDLKASWSGLQDEVPYVGWVEYPGGDGTVVTVN